MSVEKISREQYEELCESHMWDSKEEFHKMLEETTGITARRYVGYTYYDEHGNYIGDSQDVTLRDLIEHAYIDIVDA